MLPGAWKDKQQVIPVDVWHGLQNFGAGEAL